MNISLEQTMQTLTFGVELELKSNTFISEYQCNLGLRRLLCEATHSSTERIRTHSGDAYRIIDGRLKGWTICHDGSVGGGCELVSPVLTMSQLAVDIPYLCELLNSDAFSAYADHQCGFHIHVGRANRGTNYDGQFSPACIKNLIAMFQANYDLLVASCIPSGRDPRRWARLANHDLVSYLKITPASKLELSKMKSIFYGGADPARVSYYFSGRYAAVNLHSLWFEGANSSHTLEIRLFNGTVDATDIVGRCMFIGALVHQADTQRSCTFEPKQSANPKFAMRTWLTRIGLNGDYWKPARVAMCQHLDGCSAWRSGVNGRTLAEVENA